MSTTTQTQSAQAQVVLVAANMITVAGGGLHVSYSTSGIDGKPHLSYQDPMRSLSFTGDEIRRVECDLGAVVSVTIVRTVEFRLDELQPTGAACERPTVRQRVPLHGGYHHASCLLDRTGIQSGAARFLPRDPIAGHGIERRVLIGPSMAPSTASCSTVTSHPTRTVCTRISVCGVAARRVAHIAGTTALRRLGRWRPWRKKALQAATDVFSWAGRKFGRRACGFGS